MQSRNIGHEHPLTYQHMLPFPTTPLQSRPRCHGSSQTLLPSSHSDSMVILKPSAPARLALVVELAIQRGVLRQTFCRVLEAFRPGFFFPLLFPQPLGQKSNPREVMKTNKASVTKEQLNRNDHGFLYYDFELSMIHVMRA